MDKLIELLNKHLFEKGEKFVIKNYYNNDWLKDVGGEFRGVNLKDTKYGIDFIRGEQVVSKHYGFIKWLVDNDKIAREGMKGHGKLIAYCLYIKSWEWDKIKEGVLLMLLSIQDNPIEFLVSILK